MKLSLSRATRFKLRVRIPSWCRTAQFAINGQSVTAQAKPDDWAVMEREWRDDDEIVATFPMTTRLMPVDSQHPNRVAAMHGPVMLAQDARFSYPIGGDAATVLARLRRKGTPHLAIEYRPEGDRSMQGGQPVGDLIPFYSFTERQPYRSYFDLDQPRFL